MSDLRDRLEALPRFVAVCQPNQGIVPDSDTQPLLVGCVRLQDVVQAMDEWTISAQNGHPND